MLQRQLAAFRAWPLTKSEKSKHADGINPLHLELASTFSGCLAVNANAPSDRSACKPYVSVVPLRDCVGRYGGAHRARPLRAFMFSGTSDNESTAHLIIARKAANPYELATDTFRRSAYLTVETRSVRKEPVQKLIGR